MLSVRCFQLVKSLTEAVDEALALDGGYWHFSCIVSRRDGGRPGGRLTVVGCRKLKFVKETPKGLHPSVKNMIDIETRHLKEGCLVSALEEMFILYNRMFPRSP